MRPDRHHDVIVIGAGLAGLAAAERLARSGLSILVLEARDRAGGRVWTTRDAATSYPIELGAEWIEAGGDWRGVLDAAYANVIESNGRFLQRQQGAVRDADVVQQDSGALIARATETIGRGDLPLVQALDALQLDASWRETRRQLLSYVEGYHAADPSRVSTRWVAQVEASEPADASQCHATAGLAEGIDALLTKLGEHTTVRFNAPVAEVRWKRGTVDVVVDDAERTTFTAAAAVVTLPLAVLGLDPEREGAVRWTPALAPAKQTAFDLLATGDVVKVVMVFDRPFWTEIAELQGASFVQALDQPIPTWWTTHPVSAPVLVGWRAGPQAQELVDADPATLRNVALQSLAKALGVTEASVRDRFVSLHYHNWAGDPFARGAYTYVLSGGADAHKTLATPLEDTLFFGGEATGGGGHNATMEGAFQSGRRAADELLSHAAFRR